MGFLMVLYDSVEGAHKVVAPDHVVRVNASGAQADRELHVIDGDDSTWHKWGQRNDALRALSAKYGDDGWGKGEPDYADIKAGVTRL